MNDSTVIGRFRYSLSAPRRPRSLVGLLRMWWHDFVIHPLFEGTELCEDCGRRYPLWSAADHLWTKCMGDFGGLLCPSCFSDRMENKGIIVQFLAVEFDKADPCKWRERINVKAR